ncbi:MAG: YheC/YheD family protein [Selenomonadaceae bacterium]|nr:YheC/YheD family protein [Selenomonadaceae bacterium]
MAFEKFELGQMKRMIVESEKDGVRVTIETETLAPATSELRTEITSYPSPHINIQPVRVGLMRSKGHLLARRSTSLAVAYMAKHFNIDMSFFNPEDIDFENKTVNAIIIENNVRSRKVIPLPKIIDNDIRCFRGEIGKSVNKLRDYCYFIRPIDGMTKQRFHDALLKDGRFKEFLIETHPLDNVEDFLKLLEQYKDVILKPLHGVGGAGVSRITCDGKQYVANLKNKKFNLSNDELLQFYEENFTKLKYILQPYINSQTKQGNPFDIRIHARRGAGGKFKTISYPRIGNAEGVVSNLATGGYIAGIDSFLKSEFGDDWKIVYDKLSAFSNTFPDYYQSFFPDTIFDIGIDVGIQKRGDSYELKLFEAYIQPGTAYIELEDAVICLEYYSYVNQKLQKESIK